MNSHKAAEWVLRIAVAGEFIGHGTLALQGKESWFGYFKIVGITDPERIVTFLKVVGVMDWFFAVLVLVKIVPVALVWMTLWGFWTALLRPLAGEPIWDFIERFANIGAPLALFFLHGIPRSIKGWLGMKHPSSELETFTASDI